MGHVVPGQARHAAADFFLLLVLLARPVRVLLVHPACVACAFAVPATSHDDEEQDKVLKKMLEDSKLDEFKEWYSLDVQLALYAAGEVAIPEPEDGVVVEEEMQEEPIWKPALVGYSWTWMTAMPVMSEYVPAPAMWVGVKMWSPPCQAPSAHLWQPPPFLVLNTDESDGQI